MGFLAARARYRRIARRFPISLGLRGYIVGKLALDPAFRAVLEIVRDSPAPIVDVGCGFGLLAHYLRENGCCVPVHGLDLDAEKIELARVAAQRVGWNDVTFAVGDADTEFPKDATVVMLDVIHYLDADAQQRLLTNLARRDGLVLLRTAPRERTWRFALVLAQEWWTRVSRWIPVGGGFNFVRTESICAPFREAGWECETRPMWGRTPFNSRLFVFRRHVAAVAAPARDEAQAR